MVIAKYLASCGLGSRRSCESLVKEGRVKLNGTTVVDLTTRIGAADGRVTLDGKLVRPREFVYYLLNKPRGYVCSRRDSHAEKLVTELVPADPPVWPVGRLDKETSGLIILTNDGELTHQLTHPSQEKCKVYILETKPRFSAKEITKVSEGVVLEDGLFIPDEVKELGPGRYRIIIHEGRKRIIRRLVAHFGKRVISLERTAIDVLRSGGLPLGRYREISQSELQIIKGEK